MWKRRKNSIQHPFATTAHPNYLVLGYGWLPQTRERGSIYFRLRRFAGAVDPSLSAGFPDRAGTLRAILAAERRQLHQQAWEKLLADHPTHVIRLGWQSFSTGSNYDTFYLPLSFWVPGYFTDGLATEFAEHLLSGLQQFGQERDLCPPTKDRAEVTLFWLGVGVYRYLRIQER